MVNKSTNDKFFDQFMKVLGVMKDQQKRISKLENMVYILIGLEVGDLILRILI